MKSKQVRVIDDLPSALERRDEIIARISGKIPVFFLDYDGTLTPIVDDPDKAILSGNTREVVRRLARNYSVAVISGRDMKDVQKMVGIETIAYVGCHGFDIVSQDGKSRGLGKGEPFLDTLDNAERDLRLAVVKFEGARVERKRFAITVHYRQMAENNIPELERDFDEILYRYPQLRKTGGKKVFEMRPDVEWDKGKAINYLLKKLYSNGIRLIPIYIGDDVTDEDAFRAINDTGIGIVVGTGKRNTVAQYRLGNTKETINFLEMLEEFVEKKMLPGNMDNMPPGL